MPKTKNRKISRSPIVLIVFVGVVLYVGATLLSSGIELKKLESKKLQKKKEIAELKLLNSELKQIKENGNADEYVIKIAREKLGLAFSDEKVFKISD